MLYETGPSEDTSYVRFVNATTDAISILSANGAAKVELSIKSEGRASRFFPVKSGTKLAATVHYKGTKLPVVVVGKPWEYITITILPDGATRVKTMLVKESPTDFNAMRASLALLNLDASCATAQMQGGSKNTTILDNVKPFSVQRRLINPVKLSVTVGCGAKTAGTSVDLSQLQAGERYSVFLLGAGSKQQAFFVMDAN